ncbi:hypothetical protein ElyMa_004859000 [Elysia marginata]|uniref:Uncharacterized protein n=1 Tax=Elysia marginata TaxID=1093978 RepID=A0AAV4IP89_9GAST|nr:hypothetical protein ElyMa_004859000 [Elysia marginata]
MMRTGHTALRAQVDVKCTGYAMVVMGLYCQYVLRLDAVKYIRESKMLLDPRPLVLSVQDSDKASVNVSTLVKKTPPPPHLISKPTSFRQAIHDCVSLSAFTLIGLNFVAEENLMTTFSNFKLLLRASMS